jgi:hypothetical protein
MMMPVFYLSGGTLRDPTNGERITEIPYVAADVETTGLSAADGHRVCEFALLRFLRGTVIDSFVSLVNPLRPIDPGASAVNGITDEMVAAAPTFADLLPRILDFLADDPLVFHNAPFDLSFLRSEARIAGGSWPGNRVIDTLLLARRTGRSAPTPSRASAGSSASAPPSTVRKPTPGPRGNCCSTCTKNGRSYYFFRATFRFFVTPEAFTASRYAFARTASISARRS